MATGAVSLSDFGFVVGEDAREDFWLAEVSIASWWGDNLSAFIEV